jgi:predicted N-acetyltransferase YhbS
MFNRIYHFLKGPSPLHPSVCNGRLSPRAFRRFDRKDLSQCLELYALNEPGRFPEGVAQQYKKSLSEEHSYHLVTESDGRIIASGGISYYTRADWVVLSFGLVRPSHQGQGLGTALLLPRLALLKPGRFSYHIFIFAVEESFGFYRRFGFRDIQPWRDDHGDQHPSGHLLLTGSEIRRCRELLRSRGIVVPRDEVEIPLRLQAG